MPSQFPLAGLLRLRHLQQDAAAATLAEANNRVSAGDRQRSAVRAELGESQTAVRTAAGLAAVAAARSASRSMLADLQAMSALDAEAARQAAAAFNAARAQSKGLEKLQEKHQASVVAEELTAEQVAVDEIAAGAWHREHEGATA